MGTQLRLYDETTTEELILRPLSPSAASPVLNYDLDLGFPKIRENKNDMAGQNGSDDLTAYFSSRPISFKVRILGDGLGTKDDYLDQLKSFCSPSRRPSLYVLREGWAAERKAIVRGNNVSCQLLAKSIAYYDVSVALEAPSGTLQDVNYTSFNLKAPSDAAAFYLANGAFGETAFTPLKGNFGDPYWELTPGTATNEADVYNPGNVDVKPILFIYGRSYAPSIKNLTDNKTLAFKRNAQIPTGHYLEVNFKNKYAYLDSDPSQSWYRWIDWSVSSWWPLRGRTTTRILYNATNPDDGEICNGIFYPEYL